MVSVGNETLVRSSGTCRLLCRVYVVGENMEILKLMEKSENNFFLIAQDRERSRKFIFNQSELLKF